MVSQKSMPKDAQVMASLLKDMGVMEYEPRVINQMLEFTYRYVTNILEDARVFSNHAKKKNLDLDDVKLAIQMQMDKSFTTPPPKDILVEIARQRNSIPLPLIRPHCGPRLPPDRYCLSACNYRLKSAKKPRQQHIGVSYTSSSTPKLNLTSVQSVVGSKMAPAINLQSKTGASLSLVTKSGMTPTVTIVKSSTTTTPSIAAVSNASSIGMPLPIIRLTSGSTNIGGSVTSGAAATPTVVVKTSTNSLVSTPAIGIIANSTTNIDSVVKSSNSNAVENLNTTLTVSAHHGTNVAVAQSPAALGVDDQSFTTSGKRKREDDGDDFDAT